MPTRGGPDLALAGEEHIPSLMLLAANYRGFPHVPSNDLVLSYPDAQS